MDDVDPEPLLEALRAKDLAETRQRAKREVVTARDPEELPLAVALEAGFFDGAALLLERGAEVHARDVDGNTALYQVCTFEDAVPALDWLLERGAKPNSKNAEDTTVLHRAVEVKDAAVVRRLLEVGADVHARDPGAQTPLHVAAQANDPGVVRQLLERGARAHVEDSLGKTPLHLAVEDYRARKPTSADDLRGVVAALLEKGAQVEARDGQGRRAFDLCWNSDVPGDVLERLRPAEVKTAPGAIFLPAGLSVVFGFMVGAAVCLLARAAGVSFDAGLLVTAPEFPAYVELLLIAVVVAGASVALAFALGQGRTPRRSFTLAMGAVFVVVGGALGLTLSGPVALRGVLVGCAALQALVTGFGVRRALPPDRP